jgi:hypothetical protein
MREHDVTALTGTDRRPARVTRLAACPASAGRVPALREAPRHASCRGVTMPDATRFRRSRAAGRRRAIANRPRRTR